MLTCAPIASADQPRAQLRSSTCHNALDPQNRTASVKVVMRPTAGTLKLQLKFSLMVGRDDSAPQTAVRAKNLGVWLTPKNPTLGQLPGDVWNFQKSVVQLDAPATYQFRVSFRWLGAGGHVIGSAVRYGKRCQQRELRPDLQISAITVGSVSGHLDENSYTAVVRNAGATAAGPFDVQFVPGDGSAAQQLAVPRLTPGANLTVSFDGPVCSATSPSTITADSALQVDDLDRSNNTATAVCPSAGASGAASAPR
jgi:hypothetical protein